MNTGISKSAFANLYRIFTFVFLISFLFTPHSFAQNPEHENMVRLVYFLPNDRLPQAYINTQLDMLIKNAQRFFADEMERHGFGRKTFKFESDKKGRAIVHHVPGQFHDAYYQTRTAEKVERELYQFVDRFKHIYFVVIEIGNEFVGGEGVCGTGGPASRWEGYPGESIEVQRGGFCIVPASGFCFENEHIVAYHELGHAFGLGHDFWNDAYLMSYGELDKNQLSSCAAEWLDASSYFNPVQIESRDMPTVKMLAPRAAPDDAVRLRFEITDLDGIHQAQLFIPTTPGDGVSEGDKLQNCISLNGKRRAIVAFDTTQLEPGAVSKVNLHVIDVHGNFEWGEDYWVDTTDLLPPPKVVYIPEPNLASVIRKKLGLARTAKITRFDMQQLTELVADGRRITDLTGLEHAKNLRYLNLYDNQIYDISSLAGLTKLRTLGLAQNQIWDVTPLRGLRDLTGLSLWDNHIRDISPLSRLTKLETLYLSNNWIQDITPLSKLTKLESLGLETNQIGDVSALTSLWNLIDLRVARNPIIDRTPLQTLLRRNPQLKLDINPMRVSPVVRLNDVELPPMYWIDSQKSGFYRLARGKKRVENFARDIPNIMGIAVDVTNNRLYWTEKTSDSTGKLRTASLNGSNMEILEELTRVPSEIVLDFVTGNIRFTLGARHGLALDASGRKLYWGERDGIWREGLNGWGVEEHVIDAGGAEVKSIAIAGDKLYWADETGEHLGRIWCVNLNGEDIERLVTLKSVPLSLAIDTPGRKLYWSTSRGTIQRANLDGTNIQTVMSGLGTPVSLVLGTSSDEVPLFAAPAQLHVRVDKTRLYPNYPNPFNPETWIPYQLAEPADVTLHIYTSNGVLIRRLALGYQAAGVYDSKSRAAYWDGKNEMGEPVASGMYFYTFSAGDFSETRKMLIRK